MANKIENSPCNMHEALVSYLYGEATADEIQRVETHLKQCPKCADEFNGFESVRSMLQHWKIEEVPAIRVSTDTQPRSMFAVLKELFQIAPAWTKLAGGAIAALMVFAVMGTEVHIGHGGFTFSANLLRRPGAVSPQPAAAPSAAVATQVSFTKEQIQEIVASEIASREKRQEQELATEFASLQAEARRTHSAEIARLAQKVQDQHDHLKSLERDVDRREGSGVDLADILFSPGRASSADAAAPDGAR